MPQVARLSMVAHARIGEAMIQLGRYCYAMSYDDPSTKIMFLEYARVQISAEIDALNAQIDRDTSPTLPLDERALKPTL